MLFHVDATWHFKHRLAHVCLPASAMNLCLPARCHDIQVELEELSLSDAQNRFGLALYAAGDVARQSFLPSQFTTVALTG